MFEAFMMFTYDNTALWLHNVVDVFKSQDWFSIGILHVFLLSVGSIIAYIAMKKLSHCITGTNLKLSSRRPPVHKIRSKAQLLKEIHYAAANCTKDPGLIERCMSLLTRYPEACNLRLGASSHSRYTPFMRACYNGCAELITYMVLHGADVKSCDPATGDHPFYLLAYHAASRHARLFDTLDLLLCAGADINAPRTNGYGVLHAAAAKGHDALVRWLLGKGANPTPSGAPLTPYQIAVKYGHHSTAELLNVPDADTTCRHSFSDTLL